METSVKIRPGPRARAAPFFFDRAICRERKTAPGSSGALALSRAGWDRLASVKPFGMRPIAAPALASELATDNPVYRVDY